MRRPPEMIDEERRLSALAEYALRGAPRDPRLDSITQLAARMFGVPMAVVNIIDRDDVFFASASGLESVDESLMGRDISFCAHVITDNGTMVVPDATLDPRFHDNPLVTGPSHFRFYAGVPLRGVDGHKLGSFCIIDTQARDAFPETDRRQLDDLAQLVVDWLALRRLNVAGLSSEARFRNIAATSPDSIICADDQGLITFWNPAAEAMFGYRRDEAEGRRLDFILPEHLREQMIADLVSVVAGGTPRMVGRTMDLTGLRRSGTLFPGELSVSMWRDNGIVSFGAIVRDVTERRRSEDRLYHLAHHDQLTGLANRSVIVQRAAESASLGHPVTLTLLELDGLRDVIGTLGHAVGDDVLRETAVRLQACIRAHDTVARLEGGEFALLLTEPGDLVRSAAVTDEALAAVARPFDIDGARVHLTASAGLVCWPLHGDAIADLLGNADLALSQAKLEGGGRRALFTPAMRCAAVARRMYDVEIRNAVERGEFELFYQPQIRLGDRSLTGAEALLRWRHPERGLISPAAFLPVLESGPLAVTVGDWVLETGCAQAAAVKAEGATDFRLGVNLFAAQFRDGDLAVKTQAVLERHGLPPSALELEITENIMLDQDEMVLEPLRHLRAMNVGIAFDDYGTGYASLSLLKSFPISRLKIDQSFVRSMCESGPDAAIVRAVLYLGDAFGLEVIAEGIETEAQRTRLLAQSCHEGQGYLFGRPMPAADFARRFIGFGSSRQCA